MLRRAVTGLGVMALLLGAVVAASGGPGSVVLWLVVAGALLVIGTVWERQRYKPLDDRRPGFGWEDSGERFFDPETGLPVAVWTDPRTGERRYVREGDAPPGR
jgi:hypothetical protein